MCDLGKESTTQQQLDFSPAQSAAQRTGLQVIRDTMPLQDIQRRRALLLLQSLGNQPATTGGGVANISRPIAAATGLYRNALSASLGEIWLQPTSYLPAIERLETADREAFNAARNSVGASYLAGAPISLYRPDLARYIAEPKASRTITDSSEGAGATTLKTLGLLAGIAAAYYGGKG